jgi:hypothetical protein
MRRRGYAALIGILLLLGVVIIVGLRHVPEQDTPTIREQLEEEEQQLEEEEREYEKRLYGKPMPDNWKDYTDPNFEQTGPA